MIADSIATKNTMMPPLKIEIIKNDPGHDHSQPQKRRRRRRRRNKRNANEADEDGHGDDHSADDTSTCATASLSASEDDASLSSDAASPHRRVSLHNNKNKNKQHQATTTTTTKKQQNQKKIHPNKKTKKAANALAAVSMEEQAHYLALDCEMVGIGPRAKQSSVARVTIVNWDGHIVYDQFVQQTEVVTDYRTFVSGITQLDLDDATKTISLAQCQDEVQALLHEKILVGHALKNDLRAMGIAHSWMAIRDTAKYEPFMHVRFADDQILWPRKLKELSYEHLHGRTIQRSGEPHSAMEDATAAMDLYKQVRTKWEKVMEYKISKTKQMLTAARAQPQPRITVVNATNECSII
jgi:RNA exonuclease 4